MKLRQLLAWGITITAHFPMDKGKIWYSKLEKPVILFLDTEELRGGSFPANANENFCNI